MAQGRGGGSYLKVDPPAPFPFSLPPFLKPRISFKSFVVSAPVFFLEMDVGNGRGHLRRHFPAEDFSSGIFLYRFIADRNFPKYYFCKEFSCQGKEGEGYFLSSCPIMHPSPGRYL